GALVAGVASAGDIGRGNVAHQLEVSAVGRRLVGLAQVRVDVDAYFIHLHVPLSAKAIGRITLRTSLSTSAPARVAPRPHPRGKPRQTAPGRVAGVVQRDAYRRR